uniref:Tat pathway signal sequence n=1 Tax=Bionectria ochroleuca TaxID=29856 RepID=A0A8H7NHC5_BIOOC
MAHDVARYTAVKIDDDEDVESSVEVYKHNGPFRILRQNIVGIAGWVLSVVLLILAFRPREDCFTRTSAYSPLLEHIPHDFIQLTTNGTLDFPSAFRGPPSPELDEEWDRISIFQPLAIDVTDGEFKRFASSIETAARNDEAYGGNFFVQPEFSHHLHCVNLLRKATFFNYEYYKKIAFDFKGNGHDGIQTHIEHCVEILRQFVMCHADVGLVTAHWVRNINHPWPDFSTLKVCRNFDGILDWTLKHQVPPRAPAILKKPPGVKALASPP